MTTLMKTLSISLLAAATLGLSAAQAQEPPRAGPPGDVAAHRAEMQQHREAMQRQHAADLRTILRLRPDQEGALQAFLAAGHPPRMGDGPGMRHDRRDPNAPPATTPQRLDQMARRQAEMGQMMERRRQAVATFYNALSPDQRAVFDALQRMHGGHGMHGGPGMRGGPGMHGGHMMHGKEGPRPPRG
jgi:hypothetical protein